ncbi:MAG: flagellar biosynthesis protein FlgD [Selenomonadaceae bacterium]|nr:flagellar biosynthesis protein FlgD [Selenomonadaceae bacterium]MBP3723773.1 flagellar biosynthesis protein FlgD [Selenomonadaceae bacterium]
MSNSLNTITQNGITQTLDAYNAQNAAANQTANRQLDKNAFLKLMVTQMQYQDPLDPQDNSEYVAELAQFSALEQMTNVSSGVAEVSKLVSNLDTSVLVGQLSSMIGQSLQWNYTYQSQDEEGNPISSTEPKEGKVTGVSISDGTPTVIVDSDGQSYQVSISDVTRVGEIA